MADLARRLRRRWLIARLTTGITWLKLRRRFVDVEVIGHFLVVRTELALLRVLVAHLRRTARLAEVDGAGLIQLPGAVVVFDVAPPETDEITVRLVR